MTINRSMFLTGLLASAYAGFGTAGDWPQWNGPNRNNVSTETDWDPQSTRSTVWARNVGLGYSGVVVAEDRLYTAGFNETAERDFIFCLNPENGEVIWSQSYPGKKWDKFHAGGTNSTPSVSGDKLYVFTREGEYRCFNAATGEILWKKNITEEFDVTLPTWGFAASPLILDEMIVLNAGRAIAFDRRTGSLLWQSDDFGHAYSTPVDFELEGRRMLALFCGQGLFVLDRKTGTLIDGYEWKTQYDVNAASPVIIDERIFISSGYNHGCAMLAFKNGKLSVVWENKNMRNQMTGSVRIGEHLYGFDQSELRCLNFDGTVAWTQRGLGQGALSAADGKLVIVSAKGEVVIAEATPEGFKELSRADVLEGGVYWTSPVLAQGRIYVRNNTGELACRDHRE